MPFQDQRLAKDEQKPGLNFHDHATTPRVSQSTKNLSLGTGRLHSFPVRGGQKGLKPSAEEPYPLSVKKLTIRRGIFTGDNIFIYCTKYAYLLSILPRKIIDSFLQVKS